MLYWLMMIVFSICASLSFYLAYLAIAAGDGPWLFLGFGLFFSILPVVAAVKTLAKKIPYFRRIENALVAEPRQRTTFVPHGTMMTLIIIAAIAILAAILVPLVFR